MLAKWHREKRTRKINPWQKTPHNNRYLKPHTQIHTRVFLHVYIHQCIYTLA